MAIDFELRTLIPPPRLISTLHFNQFLTKARLFNDLFRTTSLLSCVQKLAVRITPPATHIQTSGPTLILCLHYTDLFAMQLEHLGIAVKDLEQANTLWTALLGTGPYKQEEVISEHVLTSFFAAGTAKVELLEATSPDSAIAKYIEKKGEGLHHIAFEVENIHESMERMRAQGFQLLNEQPKRGADNKLVCFIHPKSAGGVLLELCQTIRE